MSGESDKVESNEYIEPMQSEEEENQLKKYNNKIKQLHQKQQILKYAVGEHQDKVRSIYQQLHQKKKHLYELIVAEFKNKEIHVDIGTLEEFNSLKSTIENQNKRIEQLSRDIDQQGIAGYNNDQNIIKLKNKKNELENEIQLAKKFASTQYVRDYLERPQIYRVGYEEVKYEYEMKIRLKENLQLEKQLYEKKKEELNRALQSENQLRQSLEREKHQVLNK